VVGANTQVNQAPGTSRADFLARIRKALDRPGPQDPGSAPQVPEDLVRLASDQDDLVELFTRRAGEVGMQVRPCRGAELSERLAELLVELQAGSVTLALPTTDRDDQIARDLQDRNIVLLNWRDDRSMAEQYRADAGICDVHAALAETGSLVCCSGADHARGHSLVPPVHIAVVRKQDILPDLLDYIAQQEGTSPPDLPSAQALITGPSKTADIEGVLITGVHGPGQVFIMLIEDG